MKVVRLEPFVQHYAWGDAETIPDLLGCDRDGKPWAELWLGTHPKGPAGVILGEQEATVPLKHYIAGDPPGILGSSGERYNGELPFLMKILAVGSPLSIQCHPTIAQAQEGFARENRIGVPLGDPGRNYRDANHKPEIICALTPFTALCGFRLPEEIDRLFSALGSDVYDEVLRPLLFEADGDRLRCYREFFIRLMTLEGSLKEYLLADLRNAVVRLATQQREFMMISRLLDRYPGDIAAASPLYLNLVELVPGEALYQPAGELHAYLEGVGVEVMANSDNVLRGGLTSKHVDLNELAAIMHFSGSVKEKTIAHVSGEGQLRYETPAAEFQLQAVLPGSSITLSGRNSIEILICTAGSAELHYEEGGEALTVSLSRGDACCVPAGIPCYHIVTDGEGMLYSSSIPDPV